MKRKRTARFLAAATMGVLLVSGVAYAQGRLTSVPEPADADVSEILALEGVDESEPGGFTTEELQAAREAAAREQVLVEARGPEGLYQAAGEGKAPASTPPLIGSAIDVTNEGVLEREGRVLVSARSTQEGPLRFESAIYTNGVAIVELIWQDWPETVDLQAVLQQGTEVQRDGELDMTIRQDKSDNTIEVGVFDGSVYARAYTTFSDDMTLDEVREIALDLYKAVNEGTR